MTTLVSIAQGGTGANNAAGARSNLGAAPSAAYDQANGAYEQANTARNTANSSYALANLAFDTASNAQVTVFANSASNVTTQRINFVNTSTITVSVTSSGTNANVAFTAVGGAAFDQANAAYAQANTARNTANDAYGAANTANTNALNAYAQANASYGQANTARDTANNAYGTANNAYAQANAAYGAANNRLLLTGGSINGDLYIGGNLTVEGVGTQINVSNLSVNDSIILLSANAVGDALDIGFVGHFDRGATNTHAGLIRKASLNEFFLFDNYEVEPTNNVIDVNGNNFRLGNVRLNTINANSVLILGNAAATQANLTVAHNQANTARDTANDAYASANLAYGQANSAFGAANVAYNTANSAANTVRVSQNGSSTLSGRQLNFVNTANVTISVTDAGNGNANIEFFSIAGSQLNVSANSGTTRSTQTLNFNNSSSVLVSVSNTGTTTNVTFTTLSGANSVSSTFTADGVANTYTMNSFAADANNVLVTIDGVILTPGTEYTVNSTTLRILYVPASGSRVEVRTITGGGDGGSVSLGLVRNSFVGNGSNVNFTLSSAPVDEDNCLVFVDRVFQRNSEYNVSATTLQFVNPPDNGAVIDAFVTQYLASNAAVIKSGDTMTGQLNISAGGLLVTGNVGIGTTNPVTTLTIAKDANNLTDGLSFLNNDANDNTGSSVSFYTAFGAPFATNQLVSRISGFVTNPSSSKDGNIGLYTGTGGSVSERVRVNSSGNVGIGLTNPSTRLQVNGNVRIGSSATGVDDNADYNITSGGQVSIVANDGTAVNDSFVTLNLTSGISANAASVILRGSNSTPNSNYIDMSLNNSTRMRFFANGNVSIGTTTNHAPFSIVSANVTTSIIAANGVFIGQDIGGYQQIQMNANNGAYIDFGNSANVDYRGRIIYHNASNRMEFHTNGAERVYITSAGNVGVGTSAPAVPLHVYRSGGGVVSRTQGNSGSYHSISVDSVRDWWLSNGIDTGTDGKFGIYDATAGATRLIINSSGIITTPFQPAFLAKKVTINQAPWSELTGYGSQLITSNRSSGFNLTTGRFTAPVAGVYVFHALARASDGSGENTVPGFQLWKNGSNYENIDVWGSYATSYASVFRPSFGFSIAMELAVNDFVALAYTSTSTNYVWFSGYLLG